MAGLHPPTNLVSLDKKPEYDVYVKGSPEKGELGDCPFSHRTLLTLQEKGVGYNLQLLDEQKLPEWIKEISGGAKTIPFVLEIETGKWIHDSEKIIPYLEKKYPEPKLGLPEEVPKVGANLFPTALIGFLTAKPEEEEQKKSELLKELKEIDAFLVKNGPFFGGKSLDANDTKFGPQLKHTKIAVKTIKNWELPSDLKGISTFLEKIAERDSWKKTYYTEQYVADGWKLKVKTLTEG